MPMKNSLTWSFSLDWSLPSSTKDRLTLNPKPWDYCETEKGRSKKHEIKDLIALSKETLQVPRSGLHLQGVYPGAQPRPTPPSLGIPQRG